jgi:hypothetical protein
MEWLSRKVFSWRLSNTMEADFCVAPRRKMFIERRRSLKFELT